MRTVVVWLMSMRAMLNSSLIHSVTDEWDATVSYVAVADTSQKCPYFGSTKLK